MTEPNRSFSKAKETTEFICGRDFPAVTWTPLLDDKSPNNYLPGPCECHTCHGTGIISYTENMAPDGEGYWPMAFHDYCPDCLAQGLCPICGQKMINDDWNCTECSYRGPLEE